MINKIALRLSRRKAYNVDEHGDIVENHHGTGPKLLRVLSTFDLALLGIGSTLGVGIYVLAGSVAKNYSGPAVCLSFLIAAVASAISALCYAEFGARVPKAGSAYVYSYVTVGELVAFVIGWNLILEYLIGTASVARALSSNVDAISNYTMTNILKTVTPINIPYLSPYPDWLSLAVCIIVTIILSTGMKSSSLFTNIFAFFNLAVVLFVIAVGAVHASAENWNLAVNTTQEAGAGGFFPYGVSGVMAGAAKCFFGFVGFDSISGAGEEARNPTRSVPLSILITLVVVLLAYVGISTTLTLMWPYYLQDVNTPLVYAFQQLGLTTTAWFVTVGSIFGLSASLLGAMMPLPRVVYAMAKDGLIFRFLATVHPKFKTPFTATLFTGLLAALFSMLTELDALVDMMSIGTLLAYTLVAVSILILRYEWDPSKLDCCNDGLMPWHKEPNQQSSRKSKILILIYCLSTIILCAFIVCAENWHLSVYLWTIVVVLIAIPMLICLIYLSTLPRSVGRAYFMVPFVPLVPAASVFVNVYLMLKLSPLTWIRFALWMVLGLGVYCLYGVKHSLAESRTPSHDREEDRAPLVINQD